MLQLVFFTVFVTSAWACLTSGVCGGSYCAPPVACQPASCQPGYSCGQYGCARNRARSALTQKVDGVFIGDEPLPHPIIKEKKSGRSEDQTEEVNNIFGMRRGSHSSENSIKTEDTERNKLPIDRATLANLTNPNFIFRQCCEQRGLPDACLNKCHFNTFTKDALQAMYFKSDRCPLEAAADMQFCAAQGRDHTACCNRNGVATTLAGGKCLTFCDQRPDRITKLDYSYVPCYDRFENMKRCFYNEIKAKAEEQFGKYL